MCFCNFIVVEPILFFDFFSAFQLSMACRIFKIKIMYDKWNMQEPREIKKWQICGTRKIKRRIWSRNMFMEIWFPFQLFLIIHVELIINLSCYYCLFFPKFVVFFLLFFLKCCSPIFSKMPDAVTCCEYFFGVLRNLL